MPDLNETRPIALVTGATGMVGPTLVRHLIEAEYAVRVLVRTPPASMVLPPEAEVIMGDITRPETLPAAVDGVAVVFHLAAKLHINDPSPALAAEYERVNVHGTRHIARAAAAAGVPRFIHFSTINVYGPAQPGLTYDERHTPDPDTFYARTKLEAEAVALSEHPGVTVLRLAAVYGPRMSGNYPLLLRALRHGVSVMVGDGQNRRTLVYVADVARAALAAAQSDGASGETYNVTDGEVHSFDSIARAMQHALGKPERMAYLPAAPFRWGLSVASKLASVVGRRIPGPALIDKLTEDMAASGGKLQEDLGFRPHFPLQKGWRRAVEASSDLTR